MPSAINPDFSITRMYKEICHPYSAMLVTHTSEDIIGNYKIIGLVIDTKHEGYRLAIINYQLAPPRVISGVKIATSFNTLDAAKKSLAARVKLILGNPPKGEFYND